jgi:predicted metal-dependent phosphoesterase TrpH
MRVDLHMHTRFSPDSEMSPESLVKRCVKVGLDCIAVTDHNTIEGAKEVKRIAPFTVIVGEEVESSDGEITGLFLEEAVPRGLSPLETVKLIKEQGGLVSIPHPYDRFRSSVITPRGIEEVLPYADIVEIFNSRNSLDADNRKAVELADEHGLLTSGVSDAHTPIELGRTYVEMPDFDGTPEDFKQALAQGTIVARKTSPLIHVLTALTKAKRRVLGSRVRPSSPLTGED